MKLSVCIPYHPPWYNIYTTFTCSHTVYDLLSDGVCGCKGDNVGLRAWMHTPMSDESNFQTHITYRWYTVAKCSLEYVAIHKQENIQKD